MSSMRSTKRPLASFAADQAVSAEKAWPRCSKPVGDGAKRVANSIALAHAQSGAARTRWTAAAEPVCKAAVPAHPTPADIAQARRELASRDPAMARIDAVVEPFVWRTHPGGFATLARMIVDQQVSLASAAAVWSKLETGLGAVTPERVLAHSEDELRGMAMSRQKARYLRALAEAEIDFDALAAMDADAAEARLTAITGIGRWTAAIYLLFSEGRPDAFPAADLALQEALRAAADLPQRPNERALLARAEAWRPWRGVAAHLLWAYYRLLKGRPPASPAA